MSEWFEMEIITSSKEGSEKLIRSFIKNAVRELESKKVIEGFHFFRYTPDDRVRLRLLGKRHEAEGLLTTQIQTWISQGAGKSFRFNDYALEVDKFGEAGSKIASKLFEIGSRAAFDYMDKFPDRIHPIDTTKEKGKVPVGTWILIHALLQNIGHNSSDEMNACLFAINNRIDALAERSKERAIEVVNQIDQTLTRIRKEIET